MDITQLLLTVVLTVTTILLIIVGIQFIGMGLLGEMMVRVYHETQKKPIYVIKKVIGPGKQ